MAASRRNWIARTALLLALQLIGGCAALLPPSAPDTVSGRLSLQIDAQGARPAQRFGAGFDLSGNAERGSLHLTTPLGTTLAQASWSPDAARLVTPQGEQHFADLDALSLKALGEALPLRALPDWLRGRPWPGAPSHVGADTSAPGFEQLGWVIDLARFGDGWVKASRPGPPAVLLRARLDGAH